MVLANAPSPHPGFVTALGMGTVFVGLICIVIICWTMSVIVRSFAKKTCRS